MKIISESMALIKEGFFYTAINMLERAFPFLILPLIIRMLSTSEYGYYSYYIYIESMLIPIVSLNIHNGVSVHYYKSDINVKEYIVSVFSAILLFVFGFIIIQSMIPESIFFEITVDKSNLISVTLSAGLSVGLVFYSSILRMKHKLLSYGKFILGNSLLIYATILLVSWQYNSSDLIIRSRSVVYLILYFITAILLLKEYGYHFKPVNIKRALVFSYPTVFYSISAFAFLSADRFLIKEFLGFEQLGIYSAITQLAGINSVIAVSIGVAWNPWLYEKISSEVVKGENSKIVLRSLGLIVGFMVILTILFLLLFPTLIIAILPDSFSELYFIGIPTIIAFFFQSVYLLFIPFLYFYEKTKISAWVGFCVAILSVMLNIILIQSLELLGASITYLVTWMVLSIVILILANRYYPFICRTKVTCSL